MKRAITAILVTITGLVLLLTFKTHATAATSPTVIASNSASGDSSSASSTNSSSTTTSTPSASSGSSSSTSGTKTVTGDSVDTRYGAVQVQITVVNGQITKAVAVQYPDQQPRDQQINSYAIPQLEQETVSVGSANIDMVSGATYTSQGYISSLQSALSKV